MEHNPLAVVQACQSVAGESNGACFFIDAASCSPVRSLATVLDALCEVAFAADDPLLQGNMVTLIARIAKVAVLHLPSGFEHCSGLSTGNDGGDGQSFLTRLRTTLSKVISSSSWTIDGLVRRIVSLITSSSPVAGKLACNAVCTLVPALQRSVWRGAVVGVIRSVTSVRGGYWVTMCEVRHGAAAAEMV